MSELRSQLEQIAAEFVSSVLGAMRSASLSDLAGQAGRTDGARVAAPAVRRRPGRPPRAAAPRTQPAAVARPAAASGRRHRASAEEVQNQKNLALATAKQLPGGFSKGDVMKRSGAKVDLGRALTLLVSDGKLTKKGDRRNTRYWVK
jgi:hypothetical protein